MDPPVLCRQLAEVHQDWGMHVLSAWRADMLATMRFLRALGSVLIYFMAPRAARSVCTLPSKARNQDVPVSLQLSTHPLPVQPTWSGGLMSSSRWLLCLWPPSRDRSVA